jgi:hypothetical protein
VPAGSASAPLAAAVKGIEAVERALRGEPVVVEY